MKFVGGPGAATSQGNIEGEGVMPVFCLGTGGNLGVVRRLVSVTSVAGMSSQNYSLHTTCSDTTMGPPFRPLMDIIFPVRTVAGTSTVRRRYPPM